MNAQPSGVENETAGWRRRPPGLAARDSVVVLVPAGNRSAGRVPPGPLEGVPGVGDERGERGDGALDRRAAELSPVRVRGSPRDGPVDPAPHHGAVALDEFGGEDRELQLLL